MNSETQTIELQLADDERLRSYTQQIVKKGQKQS